MCAVLNVLVKSFNFIDAPQPVSLARSRRRQAFDRREVRKREMQFRLKVGIFLMIFFSGRLLCMQDFSSYAETSQRSSRRVVATTWPGRDASSNCRGPECNWRRRGTAKHRLVPKSSLAAERAVTASNQSSPNLDDTESSVRTPCRLKWTLNMYGSLTLGWLLLALAEFRRRVDDAPTAYTCELYTQVLLRYYKVRAMCEQLHADRKVILLGGATAAWNCSCERLSLALGS